MKTENVLMIMTIDQVGVSSFLYGYIDHVQCKKMQITKINIDLNFEEIRICTNQRIQFIISANILDYTICNVNTK